MPTTKRDLQALHYLAQRLREETYGAGEWHDAGLASVLDRLLGHNLAVTVERVARHAADPEARTPAAIERPFVPGPPETARPYPPKSADACPHHPGGWRDNCAGCRADQLAGDQPTARGERSTRTSESVTRLRAVKAAATAGLCSHGVDRHLCIDHRPAKETR